MRIVLTGGGTGGHFYPLIAVAEGFEHISQDKRLLEPELFYVGPTPFDQSALAEHDITYRASPAGRSRRYASVLNILDVLKTALGVIKSIFQLFNLYPDVVFSTGGYAAFPTVFAARILRIPVVIYDADATPGRVTLWSAKFAKWIAIAHPDAAKHFSEKIRQKVALVGHPIRSEIVHPASEGGHEFLKLDPTVPTLFVMGGSQGAQAINNVILDALPFLVKSYNVIHQAGTANLDEVRGIASVILNDDPMHAERYRPFGLLNTLALRMSAGITDVVVARAGSGTIFEVASWGIPAILIPIPLDVSHDQTENAFSYARAGGAVVIEQRNLTHHVLLAEIERILTIPGLKENMQTSAKAYARPDAAKKIAQIIMEVGLTHEPN